MVLIRIGELSMIPNIILHVVDEKQKKRFKRRSAISFETRYNTSNTWLVFVARSFHSLLVVWRRDLPNHGGGSV